MYKKVSMLSIIALVCAAQAISLPAAASSNAMPQQSAQMSMNQMGTSPQAANAAAQMTSSQAMQPMNQGQMMPAASTAANLYLVTMDMSSLDPTTDPEDIRMLLGQISIPGMKELDLLQSQGKIVSGGLLTGGKSIVFIVQAATNDEVDRMLKRSPLYLYMDITVTPLDTFKSRIASDMEVLNMMSQPRMQQMQQGR